MKITSYDSQGKLKKVAIYELLVPDYIMSFDKDKSVFPLYRQFLSGYPKNEVFKVMMAETLFSIDFGNFIKSPFSQLKKLELGTGETSLSTLVFVDCEYEFNKLVRFLNYYGHKSRQQIANDNLRGKYKDIDCLSANSWILSLANYAKMKANRCERCSDPYEIVFRIEFQTAINRYYLALRNMLNIMHSTEAEEQIRVLKPFVSRNLFRIEPIDIMFYHTEAFLLKLVKYLSLNNNCRRHDAYCILQLLRGDYHPANSTNDNLKLLGLKISEKKYDETPVIYNLKGYDGGYYVVELSDKELFYISENPNDKGVKSLLQLINNIKEEYEKNAEKKWDNSIFARKLESDLVHPEKIQSWSYLFYDELSRINKISNQESWKAQTCYYYLIYSSVNRQSPQEIVVNCKLLCNFFGLIRRNNSENQEGFYEKLYTMNKIIANADLEDLKLMAEEKSWNQIMWYKKRIEAIDDLIRFLEPILNSAYVNENIISIDSLKKMIRNILKMRNCFKIATEKRPAQLIKKIEAKKGCTYNCNIALLFNILGVLYRYNIFFLKGSPYLLRQSATNAFNELVLPYGITGDKNNNKFLTRYDQPGNFSLISEDMEQTIVNEMRKREYYIK